MTLPLCKCGCGQQVGLWTRTNTKRGAVKGQPTFYLIGHCPKRRRFASLKEAIIASVKIVPSGCWIWQRTTQYGYGRYRWKGQSGGAHRFAYTEFKGPIPDGMTLDHLCRTPACCNPEHLEPVTLKENQRRAMLARTHCSRGHERTAENTFATKTWSRACRVCSNEDSRRKRQRMRDAEHPGASNTDNHWGSI